MRTRGLQEDSIASEEQVRAAGTLGDLPLMLVTVAERLRLPVALSQ
jgi:hypothetical protein